MDDANVELDFVISYMIYLNIFSVTTIYAYMCVLLMCDMVPYMS